MENFGHHINRNTLLPKAMFGFFGTSREILIADSQSINQETKKLFIDACRLIYRAIMESDRFDDKIRIGDDFRKNELMPEKFNLIYNQIKKEVIDFTNRKMTKFCFAFGSICIVANDILSEKWHDSDDPLHADIRELVLGKRNSINADQNAVLSEIHRRMIENAKERRKNWVVTYDNDENIIIRNNRAGTGFLSRRKAKEFGNRYVEGRYYIYRKRMANIQNNEYIREYIKIFYSKWGYHAILESVEPGTNKERHLYGVVTFMEAEFWIVVHGLSPHPKLRFIAIDRRAWEGRKLGNGTLSGLMISNFTNGEESRPGSIAVIFKPVGEETDGYANRVRYLSRADMDQRLNPDEIGSLDNYLMYY